MFYIILLYSLQIFCQTAPPVSIRRYTTFYKNNGDAYKSLFFDSRTFGIDIYKNPCEKVTNAKFRTYVNNNIKCIGDLCKKGGYHCEKGKNAYCYHVEHIFDINGDDFKDCKNCKDIAANKVMVNGRWNMGLGGLARNYYNDSKNEKEIIYGKRAMDGIFQKILSCRYNQHDKKRGNDYDSNCDTDEDCECDSDTDCGCDCSDSLYWEDNCQNNTDILEAFKLFRVQNYSRESYGFSILIFVQILMIGICYIGYKRGDMKCNKRQTIESATISELEDSM